jgi:hypothetical protein
MIMRTAAIGLFALAASTAACGQISYMDVKVTVDATNHPNISQNSFAQINTCEVHVSGATSDIFTIDKCMNGMTLLTVESGTRIYDLGTLQYGTSTDSGTLNFEVDLRSGDTSKPPLGKGTGSGSIKSGQHSLVSVVVNPDMFL